MNEKLEKRILDVTIEVCAHNEPGVFSTRLIAKKADTSEGTIFLHFRNKRNLIFAAERQMGTELIAASQVITANAPTFQDFYSGCVDYVLKRPDWVAFINTYSHVFPRPKDDYGEGSYINRLREAGEDSIRKYFPSVSAEMGTIERIIFWSEIVTGHPPPPARFFIDLNAVLGCQAARLVQRRKAAPPFSGLFGVTLALYRPRAELAGDGIEMKSSHDATTPPRKSANSAS